MIAAGKVSKLAEGVPSMKLNLEVKAEGHKWAGVARSNPGLIH